MEYLPESDVSTPKASIIISTLAAVVVAAIGVRLWLRTMMKSSPARIGGFDMRSKDFGDAAETRRDVTRTFAAGCIFVVVDNEPTLTAVRAPPGLLPGVDATTVAVHIRAFAAALKERVPSIEFSESGLFDRLLPMLTVNPAISALEAAGEMPMLKHNRFIIRVTTGASDAGAQPAVHCLTIGYVSAPPNKPKSDQVLTVASPNLLVAAASAAPDAGYALTYALRASQRSTLDEEMAHDEGILTVPVLESAQPA